MIIVIFQQSLVFPMSAKSKGIVHIFKKIKNPILGVRFIVKPQLQLKKIFMMDIFSTKIVFINSKIELLSMRNF